jgi:transglutaminase-like putative cysteine protease
MLLRNNIVSSAMVMPCYYFKNSMSSQPQFSLNLNQLHWLSLTLLLVILPHLNHLSFWVMPVIAMLLTWRYVSILKKVALPGLRLRLLMTTLILIGIFLSYGTFLGRDVGVAFLLVLIGLKFLELRSLREALLIIFLSYFLILTHLLYSQSIPQVLYLALVVLVITTALISFVDNHQALGNLKRLRLASTLLLQALPLMLILFVLFPRISGHFLGLPNDAFKNSVTGFSDTLTLGNLGKLALSDKVAFRVKFEGNVPPPEQRYWRGVVLLQNKNNTWQREENRDSREPNLLYQGDSIDYTIILEPHHQHWLFALDMPTAPPSDIQPQQGVSLLQEYQLRLSHKLTALVQYSLRSYPIYRTQAVSEYALQRQLKLALELPHNQHPLTRALAKKWQEEDPDPSSIVKKALTHFNQEAYFYTLEPPPFNNDPIDEFLFDNKAGFCEHYSAAFVTLMRAASVPARIVVGYQGGALNPLGDYLVVRQRDAHAWTEVWLKDQGWVRVDPTAAVNPSRIENGIAAALPEVLDAFEGDGNTWLNNLRYRLDLLNNNWNQWVLGYGHQQQQNLLQQLGLKEWGYRGLVILMMGGLAILLLGIALWLLKQSRAYQTDPVQRDYQKFCHRLARYGIHRAAHEGAQTLAEKALKICPQHADSINTITQLYIALRYQTVHDDQHLLSTKYKQKQRALRVAVRQFR